jgi:ketosteroid isomerase-like protein
MSKRNVKLARDAASSLQALADRLAEDVIWDNTRSIGMPLDHVGVFAGKPAVLSVMRSWVGTWADYRFDVGDVTDAGDSVVLEVHESGRGRTSGAPMEAHYSHVWTFRDGLIVAAAVYADRHDALAAVRVDRPG